MLHRTIIAFATLISLALLGCAKSSPSRPAPIQEASDTISAPVAWSKIRDGALLVDVRSVEEYREGHIDGALLVPHTNVEENLNTFGPDHNREIVLYCRSGRRAALARDTLLRNGYRNVYNAGGYSDLISNR